MAIKWISVFEPNAGTTVTDQIFNEVSQCIESFNVVKDGRWKTTFTLREAVLRDQYMPGEFERQLLGVSLAEQPNKYYFIIPAKKISLEADSSIQKIMDYLECYKVWRVHNIEGAQFLFGDFRLRIGKFTFGENRKLKAIVMEVEYLPLTSIQQSRKLGEEFSEIFQDVLSRRSVPGHFNQIDTSFAQYGLSDCYTSQHTVIEYAALMDNLVAPAKGPKLSTK